MDESYRHASHGPQAGMDAFGTPPGRTMVDRYNEPAKVWDAPAGLREPFQSPRSFGWPIIEARTWWQTAIWACIVVGVILGLIFL